MYERVGGEKVGRKGREREERKEWRVGERRRSKEEGSKS